MTRKIYITDCEGPVSKNDNAYEIADAFIPDGGKLFTLLSKFDDYLGDVEKVPGYKCGATLRYILPFLKAAGATDAAVRDFSRNHISIVKGVKETISAIRENMDVYVVSTSYVHYIEEVARFLEMDPGNTFSTTVSFDAYEMGEREQIMFTGLLGAFLQLPPIEWDEETNIVGPDSLFAIDSLKTFFFERLPSLPASRWMKGVDPVGGRGKAEAIQDIVTRTGVCFEDVIYVGDSITDVEAFQLVRENGGLSVSFNGNRYAVLNAEYVVVSREAMVLKDIARSFAKSGKEDILEGTVSGTAFVSSHKSCDIENVLILSENMRREVRGEAIGNLG